MARHVFSSFHYERDVWRASVVRNSWVTKGTELEAGFWDKSLWEEAKRKGADAIKRMINSALDGTSVTAVLIGAETADREWVDYEIKRSYQLGKGLLGIYIHNIRDNQGYTDRKGRNPFDGIYIEEAGRRVYFSQMYRTYDWVNDNGYENLADWVEDAAGAGQTSR